MRTYVGILTAGGDSPGLNAAIRAVGKAAMNQHDMRLIGFLDGFRGMMENRTIRLDDGALSGILTRGGTILGTSRDKPHKMPVGDKMLDMTDLMVANYRKHDLDALVCLGGGGTQKNAYRLAQHGLNIITLPKTIDNDVGCTDITFGFDTALTTATEAIDKLHSTAHSHHRIIICEIMGHNTGWLALGAGIAGGADVILIPEIPYNIDRIAEAILRRSRGGSRFSIVAVSEGAMPEGIAAELAITREQLAQTADKAERKVVKEQLVAIEARRADSKFVLPKRLEELTRLETRVTILGHLQRGGAPSPADRLLATQLGTACAGYLHEGRFGIMVAVRGEGTEAVPLEEVVGNRKNVPADHPWIRMAGDMGISLGD